MSSLPQENIPPTGEPSPAASVAAAIIPESEHPIREQQLDREALKVLYRLRDAGFKGYLVEFGLTPAARSKVKVDGSEQKDELDEFFGT